MLPGSLPSDREPVDVTDNSRPEGAGTAVSVAVVVTCMASASAAAQQRNLNIWDQSEATIADARIAHQQVLHDAEHPSRVLLPVIPEHA